MSDVSAPSTGAPATLGIDTYAFVVRRQWRIIAACAALGIAAGALAIAVMPRTYTASATVQANVISQNAFNPNQADSRLFDAATEISIARSEVVISDASEAIPGVDDSEIRGNVEVTVASDSTVVTIDYTAASRSDARAGADAIADAYLAYRGRSADERLAAAIAGIDVYLEQLQRDLDAAEAELAAAAPGSPEAARAEAVRSSATLEVQTLTAQRADLVSVDTTGGSVLSTSTASGVGVSPSPSVFVLTGVAAGLALGIVLAFLVDPRDRRLRNTGELARASNAPVLAVDASDGDRRDAARVLRERILAATGEGTTRILLLDATGAAHLADVAYDIAEVIAAAPRRSLFIGWEMSDESRSELIQRWRVNRARVKTGAQPTAVAGLDVYLPDAPATGDEADTLINRGVVAAMRDAEDGTVCTLAMSVDAPGASVLAALRVADAVVLVLRPGSSRRDVVERITSEVEQAETPLLGGFATTRRTGRFRSSAT